MTNAELHKLAMDPCAFDTELAALHESVARAERERSALIDKVHRLAGDRKEYLSHRQVWHRTYAEVMTDPRAAAAASDVETVTTVIAKFMLAINEMDAVYREYRWTRFFPSVTKSQPHIHRSLTCHTLYPTTVMSWAPGLSGKTDPEAVAELDEALCSVCFPGAPVALREYVSRRSQAEQAERQAEKDARQAVKDAKQLTPAEQFMTEGRFGERVTTVAACKALVRKAVELAVEVEYWTQAAAGTRSVPNWSYEQIARRLGNLRDSASEAATDANRAKLVLMTREAEHEGWGATQAEITKMQQSKDRSARKEWGL